MPFSVKASHTISLLSVFSLLALYSIQTLFLQSNLTLWVVSCLPLVLFIPSLIKKSVRAYQWLGFVILVYFVAAVLTALEQEQRVIGILSVFFCVLLFMSAIVFINQIRKS